MRPGSIPTRLGSLRTTLAEITTNDTKMTSGRTAGALDANTTAKIPTAAAAPKVPTLTSLAFCAAVLVLSIDQYSSLSPSVPEL
jgi:hypothetical protein